MIGTTLRILQANTMKSKDRVMMHLFGEKQVQDAEILAIQEPQTGTSTMGLVVN